MGTINFLFMVGYASGLYVNGNIGDKLNLRKFYSFGLAATSCMYFVLYYMGKNNIEGKHIFYTVLFLDGYFQSIVNNYK